MKGHDSFRTLLIFIAKLIFKNVAIIYSIIKGFIGLSIFTVTLPTLYIFFKKKLSIKH